MTPAEISVGQAVFSISALGQSKAGLRGSQRTVTIGSTDFPAGGDVIAAINSKPLTNNAEQINVLITYEGKEGDQIEFTLLRDGREIIVPVTLEIFE